ncbi:MAG: anti-sigma factor [Halomonas sp.]|uniref:sigma-E factor negative regulatory protein n=1 Tax=Halomonas sp. TaxID=1486246 RepID=UPI0018295F98|nr:RseA family anti-sigma factor [Halomonas sp.]NWN81487.1 anti-sigma factor [Halomonas sp.]
MSQNARESLSALMDNEGDELELRRVLKSLEDEPDAAQAWRRYHLMRSMLRRETEADVSVDLSAGVLAQLQQEPAPAHDDKAPAVAPRQPLPLVRSAGIAAAVTLLVITGVQFYNGGGIPGDGANSPELVAGAEEGKGRPAPASLAGADAQSPASPSSRLPLFQLPRDGDSGLMTVGTDMQRTPMFMAPTQRQSLMADEEQARLLQSYLDRHAEGAAYRSGDAWMPLLRASGGDSLDQR